MRTRNEEQEGWRGGKKRKGMDREDRAEEREENEKEEEENEEKEGVATVEGVSEGDWQTGYYRRTHTR